jgi:hypothetical protein
VGPASFRNTSREKKRFGWSPTTTEVGIAMPDPHHMDATRAFAGIPLQLCCRLRLDRAAATADVFRPLVFTAPALPKLEKTEIARQLLGLQRCREAITSENAKF